MRPGRGDRVLWLRVILRAMFDYVLFADATDMVGQRIYRDAESWLFDDSRKHYGNSLHAICYELDCSVAEVRVRAELITPEDVKRILSTE